MSFDHLSPEFKKSLLEAGEKLVAEASGKATGKDAFMAYVSEAYDQLYASRVDSDKEMLCKSASNNPSMILVVLALKAMKGE